jgi:hypothetical protein
MEFFAFLFLLVVIGIGFFSLRLRMERIREDRRFVDQYITKLAKFADSYQEDFDPDQHYWLTHRVLRIQYIATDPALWDRYGGSHSEDATRKGATLVEVIEQMGQRPVSTEIVRSLISFLVRFQGVLDDFSVEFKKRQINPFILFREGIQLILLSPILAFRWASGGSRVMIGEIARNPTFKRWSAYLSVAAIIVPLIIIIFGWSSIIRFILGIFGLLSNWGNSLVGAVDEALGSLQNTNPDS